MSSLHKNIEYYANIQGTVEGAREEIEQGLALLEKISAPIVTFFGSHRVNPDSKEYQACKELAFTLGKQGYAIMSGGGPGIMHASNSGATAAQAISIGLKAKLLTKENITDPIFTDYLSFHFIFVRRFIMSIKSEALIFYPGGFGTLNELFEYLVLMQTGIVDTVPIICVDKEFWKGLFDWIVENPAKSNYLMDQKVDLSLLHFVDDSEEVISLLPKI